MFLCLSWAETDASRLGRYSDFDVSRVHTFLFQATLQDHPLLVKLVCFQSRLKLFQEK